MMESTFSKKLAVLGMSLAAFTFGCQRSADSEPAEKPEPYAELLSAYADKGYIDMGEGVYLVPAKYHFKTESQIEVVNGVRQFFADHPDIDRSQVTITRVETDRRSDTDGFMIIDNTFQDSE